MKTSTTRSVALTVVCVILGILIALQMKNINNARLTAQNLTDIQNKLIDRLLFCCSCNAGCNRHRKDHQ